MTTATLTTSSDEEQMPTCAVCGKPIKIKIRLFDEDKVVPCMCDCERRECEREEREREASRLENLYDRFHAGTDDDLELISWLDSHNYLISGRLAHERRRLLRKICFADGGMQRFNTFDSSDKSHPDVESKLREYVNRFDEMKAAGKGLCLFGQVGRGKSYLAACVGNALIEERGIPVIMTDFISLERVFSAVDRSNRGKYFSRLITMPLLIIDDLGAERTSPYMSDLVYSIIDGRAKAGLPIIVTTNLTAEEMKNPTSTRDNRIYSRLYQICLFYEVKGADKRKDILRRDMPIFNTLLEGAEED